MTFLKSPLNLQLPIKSNISQQFETSLIDIFTYWKKFPDNRSHSVLGPDNMHFISLNIRCNSICRRWKRGVRGEWQGAVRVITIMPPPAIGHQSSPRKVLERNTINKNFNAPFTYGKPNSQLPTRIGHKAISRRPRPLVRPSVLTGKYQQLFG